MYRKFWLENSLGNKFKFADNTTDQFLSDPSNLGYQKSATVLKLGNVSIITEASYTIQNPTGELLFWGDTADVYQAYQDFMQFIKYEPLTFHALLPNSNDEYFKEGTVIQTEKTEQKQDGILRCPFTFLATTHWRTKQVKQQTVQSGTSGEGKTYPLSYPYHYAGSNLNDIQIVNSGTVPVGLMVEINGSTTNPEFALFDEEGNQYGVCKINGTYDYVQINSVDGDEKIYLENGGSVIANAASYQDLSIASGVYKTFIKLKVGTSRMTFSLGQGFTGDVRLTWRDVYVSV